MAREMINEMDVEQVTGGSIVFSGDKSTCGRNCNNQYKVNNFSAVKQYILANYKNMSEATMLSNLAAQGLLTRL